jgi:hypothetical protein
MSNAGQPVSWVVYRTTLHGKTEATNCVCTRGEWDALALAQPGRQTLVREGITTESEAEKLARGTSGDARPRHLPRS